jgi:signal transduction histidine kinase
LIAVKHTLSWKLTAAFILVALISAGLVALLIRVTTTRLLSRLVIDQQQSALVETLAAYYQAYDSWQGVSRDWRDIWMFSMTRAGSGMSDMPGMGNGPRAGYRGRWELFGLADANGKVLVGIEPNEPAGTQLDSRQLRRGIAIEVGGERVGTLLLAQRLPYLNPEEAVFLRRINLSLGLAILGALIVAVTVGLLLTRSLTRPLQALTDAARGIAAGQLEQQVAINSQDEIGELATAFNRMSQEVARVNQLRRQMTADIAHDLRTPLTVIGGYVESMRDGVLPPTAERLTLIYGEIERLQSMVTDLRMLSLADAGELPLNRQISDPRALVEQAAQVFQHAAESAGVTLQVSLAPDLPPVLVDEVRLHQVLDNLISNALRYTPPGGNVTLKAATANGLVRLSVTDTGSGIPNDELPFIFNRFHRVEKSRHSEQGESGLGLAIVKALVEAHAGKVWAESEPGKGTTVFVELRAMPQSNSNHR